MRITHALPLMLAAMTSSATPARTHDVQPDPIIALERAALDRWGKGDPYGYLDTYADEITYFDPMQPKRIDGRAAMVALYGPIKGQIKVDSYEMIDPVVQRHGDVAVLSYNLVSQGRQPSGEAMVVRWNSTAVYARVGGEWKEIHSHWSFTRAS